MTPILSFYSLEAPDSEGRMLEDIWNYSDNDLEYHHDLVQWLFPLNEISHFNADAPVLTADDIHYFHEYGGVQHNLECSFGRFARFFGLNWDSTDKKMSFADNFPDRKLLWTIFNHNHLRITRILRSLALLGLTMPAQAMYEVAQRIYAEEDHQIPPQTFKFWTEAVNGCH